MPYVFLVGGARSGKSAAALRLAASSGAGVVFLATATAGDSEMAERIAAHRQERPPGWSTVEEPLDITARARRLEAGEYVVVDCLTLWLSNALAEGWGDDRILDDAARLADVLANRSGDGAVVSNEVGSGIVPADAPTRRYRDLLGAVNVRLAARAERAWIMVAGRGIRLEDPVGG